jgi:hypothetical protein
VSENLPVRTHREAEEQIGASDSLIGKLRVLERYMDAAFEEALECAGDEPATFDEVENDGAQQAWGEARDLLREVLATADGARGQDPCEAETDREVCGFMLDGGPCGGTPGDGHRHT